MHITGNTERGRERRERESDFAIIPLLKNPQHPGLWRLTPAAGTAAGSPRWVAATQVLVHHPPPPKSPHWIRSRMAKTQIRHSNRECCSTTFTIILSFMFK